MKTYITPDGREVPIPDEILAVAKFKRDGTPDRRVKAFDEWADAQDKGEPTETATDTAAEPVPAPNPAQAYAQRVWDGQSTDLPRSYRLGRVKAAVEAQGWTMEGVTL